MPVSRARLEVTGPESLSVVTESNLCDSKQDNNDAQSSNTSIDVDELNERKKARSDVKVKTENRLEEVMKCEGECGEVTSRQSASEADVGPGEPMSAAGDASDPLNIQDIAAAPTSSPIRCVVKVADNEPSLKTRDEPANRDGSEENEMEKLRHTEDKVSHQPGAPKRNTDYKATNVLSGDGDTAAESTECEHITAHDKAPSDVNARTDEHGESELVTFRENDGKRLICYCRQCTLKSQNLQYNEFFDKITFIWLD